MVGSTPRFGEESGPEELLLSWRIRRARSLGGEPSGARRASMDERSESIGEARRRKHRRERSDRGAQRAARVERPRASVVVPALSITVLVKNAGPEAETMPKPSPFGSPPGTPVGHPSSATRLPGRLGHSASPRSLVPRASSGRARERAQRTPARPTDRPIPPTTDPHETSPRHPIPHETGVSR